ncbi:MAG: IS630 family transposase [Bacteroidales bacterium]|nr:IS630 family transposase [Bacteroidales bacterium]
MGYRWKRARLSLKSKRNQAEFDFKQKQIDQLKKLKDNGYIDLYFGDANHFGLTPSVPYVWQTKENPILLSAVKGRYLNVVGLMTRKNDLFFEVAQTTLNSAKMIDFVERFLQQIKQKTVIILDNAPIHKSKIFMQKVKEWKLQDLYVFFLPTYSPELNIIEILWRRIKYNWQPFDSYLNFQNLTENLNYVLNNFGTKYDIIF